MKGRPTTDLVYEYMFPKPRQSDPPDFRTLLERLILEVRQETHSFYGHLDTPEAKYPGLDYTHPVHRIRLSRWPWHRRLFRAFDALRLTPAEISELAKWEGTRWAKERFEREHGFRIRDTTADGFPNYADPNDPYSAQSMRAGSEDTEDEAAPAEETREGREGEEQEEEDEDSDEELESVGAALNERLREQVALRNMSGNDTMPVLDDAWESWLKNAIESGELSHVADQIARFAGPSSMLTADDIFPPHIMAAARAGHWNEVPSFLRDMIQEALDRGSRPAERPATASPRARPSIRYSNVLGSIVRGGIHAADQRGNRSGVRLPEANDRLPS